LQTPLRVDGKAVYVINSERLALTSLPVMSPEVVRCVWDEHRRMRCRRSPLSTVAASRTTTSAEDPKNGPVRTKHFEEETYHTVESPVLFRNQTDWNLYCRPQTWNNAFTDTENYEDTTHNPLVITHTPQGRRYYILSQRIACIN